MHMKCANDMSISCYNYGYIKTPYYTSKKE